MTAGCDESHYGGGDMQQKIGRRAALRKIAKGITASLFAIAAGRKAQKSGEAAVQEVCFWQYQYSLCQGGVRMEQWCYICCYGIDCETLVCEWRTVGAC
jgi:hypothetical protein